MIRMIILKKSLLVFLFILLIFKTLAKTESIDIRKSPELNIPEIMSECNDSFKIQEHFLMQLNTTAQFPDDTDKTPMCFIRCYYEKTGIMKDGILNKEIIQKLLWPATGDSVEICQHETRNETNPCIQAYGAAKCLMIRAIVDEGNKQKY